MLGQKKEDYYESLNESAVYNTAEKYIDLLAGLIIACDNYDELATFGTIDFIEEFFLDDSMRAKSKIKGLLRMTNSLYRIITHTIFLIKDAKKTEMFERYKKILLKLFEVIPNVEIIKLTFNKQRNSVIDSKKFSELHQMLRNMRENIFQELNIAELIFWKKLDVSPTALKEILKTRLAEHG